MNKEEKKAIETLKSWNDYNIRNKNKLLAADEIINIQEILLNLIEKLQKENEELHMTIARRNGYIKLLEEDLYENASNYVVPKAKIKKEIRKAKKELKKVCKREPKTKEEATFLWCVEIRLGERIKVLKKFLSRKEE